MFKEANVGSVDRAIRIVLGLVLVALPYVTQFALWDSALARWGVPVIGIVLALTGIVRFCPAYRLLGMKTCRTA